MAITTGPRVGTFGPRAILSNFTDLADFKLLVLPFRDADNIQVELTASY